MLPLLGHPLVVPEACAHPHQVHFQRRLKACMRTLLGPLAATLQVQCVRSLGLSCSGASSPPRSLPGPPATRNIPTPSPVFPGALTPRPLRRYSLCCVREFELAVPLVRTGLTSMDWLCRHQCSQPRDWGQYCQTSGRTGVHHRLCSAPGYTTS